jgi:DUF1365 family protein
VVTVEPALYVGTVRHRRWLPRTHEFHYSLFMSFLDIDDLDRLLSTSRLTSRNRWNVASFHDADHIGEAGASMRERLSASALLAGAELPAGKIFLLTHLRYAGYLFNPISLYYCFDADGRLARVLADVRNTYGGRRSYWLDPIPDGQHRFRARVAKTLFVSPFMPMDADYEFLLTVPSGKLVAHMNVSCSGDRQFDATLQLERRPWTASGIRRTLLAYPWMTARVIGAIHFEALRLRLKGLREQPAPQGRH